jgi:hypothetical protein
VALVTVAASLLTGCRSGGGGGDQAAAPAGQGYTSDQLRKALLTGVAGYRKAGEPDAGEYGSLRAIQNFNQLQRQVTLDKPQCTGIGAPASLGKLTNAAAAIATFAKDDGRTFTETLMAVPSSVADEQVKARVPAGCRSFRAQIGDQWSTHEVTEVSAGARIGDGSRTVGVSTVSGNAQVQTWYVVLRSRGYLATVTLYGSAVTQDEAEHLAGEAYGQAQKALA